MLRDLCTVIEREKAEGGDGEPSSYYEYTSNKESGVFTASYNGHICGELMRLVDAIESASVEMETPILKVTIHLCSTGGNTKYSIMFVKYMKLLQKSNRANFKIVANTNCCSAATYILAAANTACIFSDTSFIVHSNYVELNTIGAKKCVSQYNDKFAEMYSKRGKYTFQNFIELLNDPTKDYIFTPEAALTAGIVDMVI